MPINIITQSYINSLAATDPDLYNILNAILADIENLNNQVNPPVISNNRVGQSITVTPDDVENFVYVINPDNVMLSWDIVDTAVAYEIRKGSSWDTGTFVTTVNSLQIIVNPLPTGDTTYFIKAINNDGIYSDNADSVTVTVPVIFGPIVTTTSIVNTAVLQWTAPTSAFRIDHYLISRNGSPLTTVAGTFFAFAESAAGTNTYTVQAVDVAGNIGTGTIVSVTVSAPADFVLQAILTSSFAGTLTNAFKDVSRGIPILEVCVDTVEDYQTHFTEDSYASPQDQINAGYPYYSEPNETTASYVEVFDFGSIFSNVVIGVSWLYNLIDNVVSIASVLKFSTDNITYTAGVSGPTAFAASVRYVKVELDFTGAANALLELYNLQCAMSVHQELDGGSGTANSGDAGGTTFSLNKPFKSIISATATVNSTNSYKAVVSSISTTQIKIEVFDDTGARKTDSIAWKVFGTL